MKPTGEENQGESEATLEKSEQEALPSSYELEHPIEWGQRVIKEFQLKANGKAMIGFEIEFTGKGGVVMQPRNLAALGLRLAGESVTLLDHMHPQDITGLGMVALGFIMPGLGTGEKLSR